MPLRISVGDCYPPTERLRWNPPPIRGGVHHVAVIKIAQSKLRSVLPVSVQLRNFPKCPWRPDCVLPLRLLQESMRELLAVWYALLWRFAKRAWQCGFLQHFFHQNLILAFRQTFVFAVYWYHVHMLCSPSSLKMTPQTYPFFMELRHRPQTFHQKRIFSQIPHGKRRIYQFSEKKGTGICYAPSILRFIIKHTMAEPFKIRIFDLISEFFAHAFIFFCSLKAAGAVAAGFF